MKKYILIVVPFTAAMLYSCAVTRPTVTQLTPDPPLFIMAYPLRFTLDGGHAIVVPTGFITDLASIPKALWWWQSPHEGTLAPAIIHDYLYWEQSCTKDEADAVMYLAMLDVGLSAFNRESVYLGIRTSAAGKAWETNRTAREGGEPRFFTEAYTRVIQNGLIEPEATLKTIQAKAIANDGVYTPVLPDLAVKRTCQAALEKFKTGR